MYRMTYPEGWYVARYDYQGFASDGLVFDAALEAIAYNGWLRAGQCRKGWLLKGQKAWRRQMANAIESQRAAIADISVNTQRVSGSAIQVSGNLQALHATFAEVGVASGDIRAKVGMLGQNAKELRAETENFLRYVLAA